jgi:hypothetical protein
MVRKITRASFEVVKGSLYQISILDFQESDVKQEL